MFSGGAEILTCAFNFWLPGSVLVAPVVWADASSIRDIVCGQ